ILCFVECDADLVAGPDTRLEPRCDCILGDSAEFSAESLVPLILFRKRGHSLKE
ncbi:unnamed protein product, partial [Prunus brigantina]